MPKSTVVRIPFTPRNLPVAVTIVVERVEEITHVNNATTAWVGGASPDHPPPMVTALSPLSAPAGSTIDLEGKNPQPGAVVLASGSPTLLVGIAVIDAEHATLTVAPGAPTGIYLVSVTNPDGKQSNLLPLEVTE